MHQVQWSPSRWTVQRSQTRRTPTRLRVHGPSSRVGSRECWLEVSADMFSSVSTWNAIELLHPRKSAANMPITFKGTITCIPADVHTTDDDQIYNAHTLDYCVIAHRWQIGPQASFNRATPRAREQKKKTNGDEDSRTTPVASPSWDGPRKSPGSRTRETCPRAAK